VKDRRKNERIVKETTLLIRAEWTLQHSLCSLPICP